MFNELTFDAPGQAQNLAFIGGCPYLPPDTPWPNDSKGKPLLHLASLPAKFFRSHVPQIAVAEGLCIGVFTPYDVADYDYIETAMMSGGRVIAYMPSEQVHAPVVPSFRPRLMCVVPRPGEDSIHNGISKLGGMPTWLQDEELHGLEYVLQIEEGDVERAAPTHKAVFVGGIGYLLLKKIIDRPTADCGHFVVQTT